MRRKWKLVSFSVTALFFTAMEGDFQLIQAFDIRDPDGEFSLSFELYFFKIKRPLKICTMSKNMRGFVTAPDGITLHLAAPVK